MQEPLSIYTDGGARGNPGPGGAAFVVVDNGKVIDKGSKFLGTSTNNEAEYNALIMAMEWLQKNQKNFSERNVIFFLDSQLVVRQINGLYKVKSSNLRPLIQKVKTLTLNLKVANLKFISVAREKNKLADKLVNIVIDENSG